MKTYAVFQSCDDRWFNRLIDVITGTIQNGINFYKKVNPHSEVLLLPDHNEKRDMPNSLIFFEPENITQKDINWLRENQDSYGIPIISLLQEKCDMGRLGTTHGIIVTQEADDFIIESNIVIELRHVYD